MVEYEFSEHAYEMLKERNIKNEWVDKTIGEADDKESKDDGTIHDLKAIQEFEGRILRVIMNPDVEPLRRVTLFFDRRQRRET